MAKVQTDLVIEGIEGEPAKYDVNSTSNICTNPYCIDSLPHYRNFGIASQQKCSTCGQPMRRIKGEPGGTRHPPRR